MNDRAPIQNAETAQMQSRLGRLFGWAQAAILWERAWRRLWPCVTVAIVFLSIALLDILPVLPYWAHWLALMAFGLLFLDRVRRVFQTSYRVSAEDVRNRIETDSGLAHRPLTTLEDHPVPPAARPYEDNEAAHRLWQVHQARAAQQIAQLKASLPHPGLARTDQFGMRFPVLLLAVVALTFASGDMGSRLERAFLPKDAVAAATSVDYDVWITPPAYTGLAPMFFKKEAPMELSDPALVAENSRALTEQVPLTIPVGSQVLVQITGAKAVPELRVGGRTVAINRVGASDLSRDFRIEESIVEADELATQIELRVADQQLAAWPVAIRVDGPPEVEFTEPPVRTRKASLQLKFEARDDFAVKDVWAEITLPGAKIPDVEKTDKNHIRFNMAGSGYGTTIAEGQGERDHSAHRWAGLTVSIELVAQDSAGNIGRSEALETILPARTFNHPVARALVEIRKDLNHPSQDVVEQSVETLQGLMQRPAHFAHETIVFLAISVARSRLYNNRSEDSIESVQDLLWETALRIEDGEFAIAERDLREIQDKLAKAMRENAPSEEIERLMDELQEALDKYMTALAEHMERQGLSEMPMDPNARAMESMDLQNMVDQAREMAKTGAMDAAKRMLEQLNRMLDGLRNGTAMARQNPAMAKARKMMEDMRSLSQRQQELMDKTFRESQTNRDGQNQGQQQQGQMQPGQQDQMQPGQQGQMQPGQQGQQPGQGMQGMSREQAELRRELGRLMLQMDEMLGGIPPELGQAERSMKGAGEALGEGDGAGAVPQQADALENLRQAMESASEQMAQRMQGMGQGMGIGMMPNGQRGQRPGENRDPFGRRNGEDQFGSANDNDGIKVPSEREIYRAREIMEELHRRSGDIKREKPERDYIDRLLRRF